MNFVKYAGQRGPISGEPCVTISKKSWRMMFSKSAVALHELDKYKFVEFYYDEDNQAIGLMFLEHETSGCYKLATKNQGFSVSARGFCKFNNIQPSQVQNAKIEVNPNHKGMLIVKVSEPEFQPAPGGGFEAKPD